MANFDALLDLEAEVRAGRAAEVFGADYATRMRGIQSAERAKRALYAAIAAMSDDEARAFGRFRMAGRS